MIAAAFKPPTAQCTRAIIPCILSCDYDCWPALHCRPLLPLYTLFSHFIIHKFELYKVALFTMLFLRIRFIPYLHDLKIYAFFLSHRLHFLQDFDEFASFFVVILFSLLINTNDSAQHALKKRHITRIFIKFTISVQRFEALDIIGLI